MTHHPDRWGTFCMEDSLSWPCPDAAALIATGGMTWHVQPAAWTREPFIAQPNTCPVCEQELPAGHMRHPTCDPRGLQTPSETTTDGANRTDGR